MPNETQERHHIEDIIESRKRVVEYYSSGNKKKREIRIVKFFLEILHVNAQEKELSPVPDDPPDVIFRNARFEVKEILEKNRKRDEEGKKALEKAKGAKTIRELCGDYEPRAVSFDEIIGRIEETVHKECNLCPTVRKNSDLLLYVCLDSSKYELGSYNIPEHWKTWRSISMCTNSKLALVFFADHSAPDFIRANTGRPIRDETFRMNR